MESWIIVLMTAIAAIFGYKTIQGMNRPDKQRKFEEPEYEKEARKKQEEVDEKIGKKSNSDVVKRFMDVFSRKPGSGRGDGRGSD